MEASQKAGLKDLAAKKKLLLLLSIVVVAVGVALTYFYFEYAVRHSIDYIWDSLLNTDLHRALVVPTCILLSLVFFGIQHYIDQASEKQESHGLGEAPNPTILNFMKVLGIGFFSLVAGASLGPEAILVPASLIIGGYIGTKLFKSESQIAKLLSMVGFVALFAAFFNSFIAGMLGLLLVTKQVKIKLNAALVIIAALASVVTILVLKLLSSSPYAKLPPHHWQITVSSVLVMVGLFAGGYAITYLLNGTHQLFEGVRKLFTERNWLIRALLASAGLSLLYLLGGTLVEFTGNESIVPMLQKAASLGVVGLLWILVIKILAIAWSKTLGYRGGLVFPSIFVASVLVAIAQMYVQQTSFILGLIAVMAGILIANNKVKILF